MNCEKCGKKIDMGFSRDGEREDIYCLECELMG